MSNPATPPCSPSQPTACPLQPRPDRFQTILSYCKIRPKVPQTWAEMTKHMIVNKERHEGEQYGHILRQKGEKIFWCLSYKPTPVWLLTQDWAAHNYITAAGQYNAAFKSSLSHQKGIHKDNLGSVSQGREMGSFRRDSRAAKEGSGAELPPTLPLTHSLGKRWS